jgi:hypothetical protein
MILPSDKTLEDAIAISVHRTFSSAKAPFDRLRVIGFENASFFASAASSAEL